MKTSKKQVKIQCPSKINQMLASITEADFVVIDQENNTQHAFAIVYDEEKLAAPIVLAKGVDDIAVKIKNYARKHQILVIQYPNLALSLYENVKRIGDEIPKMLFVGVAEILAIEYKNRKNCMVFEDCLTFIGSVLISQEKTYHLIDALNDGRSDDISINLEESRILLHDYCNSMITAKKFQGDNAALNSINDLMEDQRLNFDSLPGIIVHFRMNPEYPHLELKNAMDAIKSIFLDDAIIIYGTTTDITIPMDYVRTTTIIPYW